MKNINYFNQKLFIGLTMFSLSISLFLTITQSAGAQSKIDLKTLKAEESARTIYFFAGDLGKFFDDEKIAEAHKKFVIDGKESAADYPKQKGEETKIQLKSAYSALVDLFQKIKLF